MAKDILITPASGQIDFSDTAAASTISLYVRANGDIDFEGTAGNLFTISDSLTGSLMSVSDISGLPILEVFDTDKVVMGEFGANALIVDGKNLGVGTADIEAWGSIYRAIESVGSSLIFENTAAGIAGGIASNTYYDGANWKYKHTEAGSLSWQNSGNHYFYTFVSGTENNNVTLLERFRIDNDGQLDITIQPTTGDTSDRIMMWDATGAIKSIAGSSYTNNTGTLTSVAITGTDGIDVDSGSPITGAGGTITLGLSGIGNAALTNSTISGVSLGGTLAALSAGNGISAAGTYTGATARTFALDFAELGVGGTLIGGDYLIAENGGVENRQLISTTPLSIFSNDSSWTSNTGTVTGTSVDNRVAYWNGTGAIQGSANLTFDNTHLRLAATSRMYFDGGGDTYIYEQAANVLDLLAGNAVKIRIDHGNSLTTIYDSAQGSNSAGWRMPNTASTSTAPVLIPNRTNLTYGIGGTTNEISVIANGVEAITAISTGKVFFPVTPTTGTTENVLVYGAGGELRTVTQASLGGSDTATAVDNILDGSNAGTAITYAPYAAKGTAGRFYSAATTPNGTVRLNYDGYFYPTYINLVGSGNTASAATHYFVETSSDGYVRPKTLANVKSEIRRTITAGGNTLAATETLAFTQGTNVTITEAAGAVTINSTDQYTGTVTASGGPSNGEVAVWTSATNIEGQPDFTWDADILRVQGPSAGQSWYANVSAGDKVMYLATDQSGEAAEILIGSLFNNVGNDASVYVAVHDTGGDPFIKFTGGATFGYSLGVDNSDGNDFKLTYVGNSAISPSLGTTLLTVQSDGEILFHSNVGGAASAGTYLNKDGGWTTPPGATSGTVTGTGVSNRIAYWSGTSAITSDSGITVTPASNTITATTFDGDLSGNADSATTATATTVTDTSAAANYRIRMDLAGAVLSTGGVHINPSTDTITAGVLTLTTLPATGDPNPDRILVRDSATGTLKVLTASGGGTTNFLRADGTWAAAGGSGTVTGTGTADQLAVWTGSSAIGGSSGLTWSGTELITNAIGSTVSHTFESNIASASTGLMNLVASWNGTQVAAVRGLTGTDTGNKDDGELRFYTSTANNLTERLRITSAGQLDIAVQPTTGNHSDRILMWDSAGVKSVAGSALDDINIGSNTSSDTQVYPVFVPSNATGRHSTIIDGGIAYDAADNKLYSSNVDQSTYLGQDGNIALDSVTNTAAEWAALPLGYCRMMNSSIGTGGGLPVANHGYFLKTANRDTGGGYSGFMIGYSANENYIGRSSTNASFLTWEKIAMHGTTITATLTGTSSQSIVNNSTSATWYPIVWHNNSNTLYDTNASLLVQGSTGSIRANQYYIAGTTHGLDAITGTYGSFNVVGTTGGYYGVNLNGRAVFMHNGTTTSGLYNDVDNKWILYGAHNSTTHIHYNGISKIQSTTNGCTVVGSGTATDWIATSDRRLKENIRYNESWKDRVLKIGKLTARYDWIDKEEEHPYDNIGFIAQDIQPIANEFVDSYTRIIFEGVEEDGVTDITKDKEYFTLNYNKMIAPLYSAFLEKHEEDIIKMSKKDEEILELRTELDDLKKLVNMLIEDKK